MVNKRCTRCLMDTTASNIFFDKNGICNFCTEFLKNSESILNKNEKIKVNELDSLINKIKLNGKNKKYDCIVGVSGGVDSSWVLVNAIRLGLRPLAVHMDNGWNSELAQNNIANLVKFLNVDLYTYVIDWEEYRSLMQAMFDADVVDIELLYDNAMTSVNYRLANKYKIKYILSGNNQSTEGMSMPSGWNWYKYDKLNISDIAKKFGNIKIKTFPTFSTFDFYYNHYFKRVIFYPFLDYFNYNKEEALIELEEKFGYKRYPYKHYESIFTRFYQGFILPKKFNIDKRLVHLSTLIMTNQISRIEALNLINNDSYHSIQDLNNDKIYFLKKMRWLESDLLNYLNRPEIKHTNYRSELKKYVFFNRMIQTKILQFIKKFIKKYNFEKK